MRNLSALFIFLTIMVVNQRCANISAPQGGPKDTIPPVPLTIIPLPGTTNFDGTEFYMEFNENIAADKIKQALIIAPAQTIKFSHIIKKNRITIKLETPLDSNTTYTFNFVDGITDNTEKNPAKNLILAFSTGPIIDSLKVKGLLTDLMTNKLSKDITVGLYPYSDTLDLTQHKPKYLVKTSESGQFTFEYLKSGIYKIAAFKDENRNAKIDVNSEEYGFISEHISLTEDKDSIDIKLVKLDVSQFKLISAKPFGKYFEIRYNKPIQDYTLKLKQDSTTFIPSFTNQERNTIKLIRPSNYVNNDSVGFIIQTRDTINQTLTDTLYYKFTESTRKKDDLKIEYKSANKITSERFEYRVISNKPLLEDTLRNLEIFIDSSFILNAKSITLFQNQTQNSFTYHLQVPWSKIEDSLRNIKILSLPDTLQQIDSVKNNIRVELKRVKLIIPSARFVSYEQDSSKLKVIDIQKSDDKEFGKMTLKINTTKTSFKLEILDKNDRVIHEYWNNKYMIINNLEPGTYKIRVKIDMDGDGQWSPGNILLNKEPERIYLYPKSTEVRANWEVEISDITF